MFMICFARDGQGATQSLCRSAGAAALLILSPVLMGVAACNNGESETAADAAGNSAGQDAGGSDNSGQGGASNGADSSRSRRGAGDSGNAGSGRGSGGEAASVNASEGGSTDDDASITAAGDDSGGQADAGAPGSGGDGGSSTSSMGGAGNSSGDASSASGNASAGGTASDGDDFAAATDCTQPMSGTLEGGDFGPSILRACLAISSGTCDLGATPGGATELICFESNASSPSPTLSFAIRQTNWSIVSITPSEGISQTSDGAEGLALAVQYTVVLEEFETGAQVTMVVELQDANFVEVTVGQG